LIANGTPDTLRELPEASPPGTKRFEVSTKQVTSALRKAREVKALRSATIFGRSIHALVDEDISQAEFAEELRKKGVEVDEIRPLVPDLEDVFVELTVRKQQEQEAARG
jgi:hypothetical protein